MNHGFNRGKAAPKMALFFYFRKLMYCKYSLDAEKYRPVFIAIVGLCFLQVGCRVLRKAGRDGGQP
jgi:hypothetical protein